MLVTTVMCYMSQMLTSAALFDLGGEPQSLVDRFSSTSWFLVGRMTSQLTNQSLVVDELCTVHVTALLCIHVTKLTIA